MGFVPALSSRFIRAETIGVPRALISWFELVLTSLICLSVCLCLRLRVANGRVWVSIIEAIRAPK
jgi:hypothetical protein